MGGRGRIAGSADGGSGGRVRDVEGEGGRVEGEATGPSGGNSRKIVPGCNYRGTDYGGFTHRSGRLADQGPQVLYRCDQPILNLLPPETAPPGPLEPVVGRRVPEAALHPPFATPAVPFRRRAVRSLLGRSDRGITESCGWSDGKERRIILEVERNSGKSRKGYARWNRVRYRPSVCQ